MKLEQSSITKAPKTAHGRLTFPCRLHILLSKSLSLGFQDVISWDPQGTKFIIKNEDMFVRNILPTVFNQSSLSSFRRQLNAYGFKREKLTKKNVYVFSHNLFCRDDPSALKGIERNYPNSKRINTKKTNIPESIILPNITASSSSFDPSSVTKEPSFWKSQDLHSKRTFNASFNQSLKSSSQMVPSEIEPQILAGAWGELYDCIELKTSDRSSAQIDDEIIHCLAKSVHQDIDDQSIDKLWDPPGDFMEFNHL